MKNKLYYGLNFIFIIVMVDLLVYYLFIKPETEYRRIIEGVALCVICLVKICRGGMRRTSKRDYKNYEEAYKNILESVFRQDNKSYKKLLKAVVCFNQDKYKKAHKLLSRLEKKCIYSQDYVAVYSFRAICYDAEKRYEQSIIYYEKVLQHNTASALAWSNMGICYRELGREKDAYMAYSNAIMYNPQDAYAHNNMAFCLIDTNEPERALKYALKAIQYNANLSEAMEAAAIAYKMLGDYLNMEKYCKMYGMNGGNIQKLRCHLDAIL